MTPSVEKEIGRILLLLRNKIREQGYTQLDVQEKLDWGRSYLSQLLNQQKSLRVEQILLILETIGVDPQEFYAELYQLPRGEGRLRNLDDYPDPGLPVPALKTPLVSAQASAAAGLAEPKDFLRNYRQLRAMVRGLVQLLVDKDVVSLDEVIAAAKAADPDLWPSS